MAKSLEETLKDLRAGGYSEGSVRNWLVNKGFPAAKVDKAMALRSVKDVTDSRRARLHRALDCVLGRSAGRDTHGLAYDHPRIQKLEAEIRRLEDNGIPYDDPRVKKLEAEIRRLEGI